MMIKKPHTIGEGEPFGLVWDLFRLHNIRHLPVLTPERKLVGIITLHDLYRVISPQRTPGGSLLYDLSELNKFSLKKEMTKKPESLSPEDTIGTAIDLLGKKKFGCIPIVNDNGILKGLITRTKILNAIAKYFI